MSSSITETPNCLTLNLDVADPTGIVRLLRQADAQMFSGFDTWPGLMDEESLEAMALVAWRLSRLLLKPDSLVVLSGAGTSGRLAHVLCLEFNRILRAEKLPEVFTPLMAGGESAIIQAQEVAEDSVSLAKGDLEAVCEGKTGEKCFIGITAGLSAPYVAAQAELCLADETFPSVVVLGFNPASLARAAPIEEWDKTVKDVLDAAAESPRFTLLNPVVGPEAVTGSTRMKGGSMTKIVLEAVFLVAVEILREEAKPAKERAFEASEKNLIPLRELLLRQLQHFQQAVDAVYRNIPSLSEMVRQAGTALRSGGRIYYVGRGVAGLLGIVDASECPPTFGADLFDVRGYLREGWEYLGYGTASMKAKGKAYDITHEYFEQTVLPDMSRGDLVIGIAVQTIGENTARLLHEAAQFKAKTALILVTTEKPRLSDLPNGLTHLCVVVVPRAGCLPTMHNEAELALKLCLNATTTGAHTMAGKIFENVMIDLRISNSKLYDRATRLVSRLASVPEEDARRALHHAVFKEQPTEQDMESTSVTTVVQRAVSRSKIIPLAILLATRRFTYGEAEERLLAEPRVRRIVEDVLGAAET